jgi:hypothetical protein
VDVKPAAACSVLRGLAVPSALFVLDGLILGQGVLTALVAAGAVVVSAPLALVAKTKHREEAFLRHLRRAIVYPATAAAVIGFVALGNLHARHTADGVIAACDAYRTAHGRYPTKLDDLVPELLPSVPRAKPTLMFGSFFYVDGSSVTGEDGKQRPSLMYVQIPPFGRPVYLFDEKRWSYLD